MYHRRNSTRNLINWIMQQIHAVPTQIDCWVYCYPRLAHPSRHGYNIHASRLASRIVYNTTPCWPLTVPPPTLMAILSAKLELRWCGVVKWGRWAPLTSATLGVKRVRRCRGWRAGAEYVATGCCWCATCSEVADPMSRAMFARTLRQARARVHHVYVAMTTPADAAMVRL